jgi:hypothetical protein
MLSVCPRSKQTKTKQTASVIIVSGRNSGEELKEVHMDRKFFGQFVKLMATAAVLFSAYASLTAQQGPPMSYGERILQVSNDDCMRRAERALRSEGYNPGNQGNNSVFGTKRNQSAYILCVDDRNERNRTRVIIITASRGGGGESTERANLERRMERSGGGGGGGCGLGRRITEYENGFTGIWTRRGRGSTYDAIWTRGSDRAEAVLDIRLIGNRVTVQRTDAAWMGSNTCTYTGTLFGDRMTGTYSCRSGGGNMQWEATVECN